MVEEASIMQVPLRTQLQWPSPRQGEYPNHPNPSVIWVSEEILESLGEGGNLILEMYRWLRNHYQLLCILRGEAMTGGPWTTVRVWSPLRRDRSGSREPAWLPALALSLLGRVTSENLNLVSSAVKPESFTVVLESCDTDSKTAFKLPHIFGVPSCWVFMGKLSMFQRECIQVKYRSGERGWSLLCSCGQRKKQNAIKKKTPQAKK